MEFDLLLTLARSPNRPFTRDELLSVIEDADSQHSAGAQYDAGAAYERTIDAHIKNLRQKRGGAGRQSRLVRQSMALDIGLWS